MATPRASGTGPPLLLNPGQDFREGSGGFPTACNALLFGSTRCNRLSGALDLSVVLLAVVVRVPALKSAEIVQDGHDATARCPAVLLTA